MFPSLPPKNNSLVQYGSAAAAAVTVTVILYGLMAYLIRPDTGIKTQVMPFATIDMVRVERDERLPDEVEPVPQEPQPEQDAPPKPKLNLEKSAAPVMDQPIMEMAGVQPDLKPSSPFLGDFAADQQSTIATNVIPLVKVEPRYPRVALRRGIEGWVKVEFTILEDGTVADAVVLESEPGNTFDREALRALEKWKFQPKVANRKAMRQRGRQTIEFKIEK